MEVIFENKSAGVYGSIEQRPHLIGTGRVGEGVVGEDCPENWCRSWPVKGGGGGGRGRKRILVRGNSTAKYGDRKSELRYMRSRKPCVARK